MCSSMEHLGIIVSFIWIFINGVLSMFKEQCSFWHNPTPNGNSHGLEPKFNARAHSVLIWVKSFGNLNQNLGIHVAEFYCQIDKNQILVQNMTIGDQFFKFTIFVFVSFLTKLVCGIHTVWIIVFALIVWIKRFLRFILITSAVRFTMRLQLSRIVNHRK